MKIFNKTGKAGFTLAETLLAMMLLLIVAALLAQGVPLAFNAYKKVDQAANANMLLSTTMTELRDKLAFSDDIVISENVITFTSSTGREYSLGYNADKEGLYLEDRTSSEYNPGEVNDSRLLVSDAAAAKELYAYFTKVEKNAAGTVLTFENLGVYSKTDPEQAYPYIKVDEFDVRLLKNGK